jgi:drug/metabolite transporter (DMT)-like permease
MGALAALASAALYGVADYTGGLLSRRAHFAFVAFLGQAGGLLLTLAAILLLPAASPSAADLGWGALSGVGTGIGMVFLYRGLSRGAMSVVVPVSAVGGVALPVLVNVTLLGDRPSALAWLGIVLTLPALWLVGRAGRGGRDGGEGPAAPAAGTVDALVAGGGIALQYLALAQAGPASGIWPVAAGRVAALLAVLPLVLAAGQGLRMPVATAGGATGTGIIAALALVCYLYAVQDQLAVIAVVLSSLYPAVPVLLGLTLLRERLTRGQTVGLVAAGAATMLLSGG